jgi:hypothetical protein
MTTPNPITSEITGRAAHKLHDALAAAARSQPRPLELAGDVIDTGWDDEPCYGMLAVLDGAVVRITVEPARPEEAAAVLGGEL